MNSSVSIIKVDPSRLDELLILSKKTFYNAFEHLNNPDDFEAYASKAFTHAQLLSEIENPDSEFYFALLNDKAVGYIKLNYRVAQAEFRNPDAMEISRIYVLATQQGKQIGQRLLDFAIRKAIEDKLQDVWLDVWKYNDGATRFYERNGFVKFSSHTFVLGNDHQTDDLMKLELTSKTF